MAAPNGNVTTMVYDSFGRLLRSYDNPDSDSQPSIRFTYDWDNIVPNRTITETLVAHGTSNYRESVSCTDGFGREIDSRSENGTGYARVRTDYDSRGLVIRLTNPFSGSGINCVGTSDPAQDQDRRYFEYDPLGNVTKTYFRAAGVPTGGPYTESIYEGLTTTSIDENRHRTRQVLNPAAKTLTVHEDTGNGGTQAWATYATTVYQYDVLGQLTKVTDALLNETRIYYDLAGRKIEMDDPDMGQNWLYTYDAASNLKTQTDARGEVTTLNYDDLQRLRQKTYSGPIAEASVSYGYDTYAFGYCTGQPAATATGRQTTMTDASGSQYGCYDIRGRDISTQKRVDGVDYDLASSYTASGEVATATYPGSGSPDVTYAFNNDGALTGMTAQGTSVLSSIVRQPSGQLASYTLGGTMPFTFLYDSRQRMTRKLLSGVQDLTYTFDDASNVKTVADGAAETVTYNYDDLDRLTSATGFTGGQSAAYEYDKIGNLTRKREGALDLKLDYPASNPTSVRPHAVTAAKHYGSRAAYKTLAYDANGNLDYVNSAAESDYTFDAENRVKTRTYGAATTSYVYDGAGAMVKRTTTGLSGSETSVYIGGIYEKNITTGVVKKYYGAMGQNFAMSDNGTLRYLLSDHLGGITAVLDATGNVVSTRKYWPYGAERSVSGDQRATDKWYTGQRDEDYDGLGLYNYKARFYSTVLGRFVSADPIAGGLNRYEYVLANPLRHTDPTGLCPPDQCAPTPSGTPSPNDPSMAVQMCAYRLGDCLVWSYTAMYGSADVGFVIGMGWNQPFGEFMKYSGYIGLFWDHFVPACGGNAMPGCFEAIGDMLQAGKAKEAFDIFGVLIIETYPSVGWLHPSGVTDRITSHRLDGYDTLDWAMSKSGKPVVGIIGMSSGAATVSQWARDNPRNTTPFFLIEPVVLSGTTVLGLTIGDIDFQYPSGHPGYRGSFPYKSCTGGSHCTHNSESLSVMHSLMPYEYSYP